MSPTSAADGWRLKPQELDALFVDLVVLRLTQYFLEQAADGTRLIRSVSILAVDGAVVALGSCWSAGVLNLAFFEPLGGLVRLL